MGGFGKKREIGKVWAALFLVFVIFLIYPQFLQAQALSTEICLSCHAAPGLEKVKDGKSVSLTVGGKSFGSSVHGPLGCAACHTDVSQVPHAPSLKPVECSVCHADAAKVYSQSIHGRAHEEGDGDAASCSDCHGNHEIMPASNPNSKVYPFNLPRTCGVCHGDPELAKRHNIPVANAYQLYMDSIHGRALTRSGLLVSAHCGSCHGSHDIQAKREPTSRVNRSRVPATCGSCHAGILTDYFQSGHGKAVEQGSLAAPVCIDCHTAHEIRRVEVAAWQLDIIRECGTCHRESLRSYRDTFHGQVSGLGFTRVARCSDCHGSHLILSAADPKSSIAPEKLVSTCQKCHPKANQNFVLFSPHADPQDKDRNPGLYYAALFMHSLLIGVFAFFGLHAVLWLFRSSLEVWQRRNSLGKSDSKDDGEDDEKPES